MKRVSTRHWSLVTTQWPAPSFLIHLSSFLIETRSLPALTHVLPPISTCRFSHLCRALPGGSIHSLLPSQLCLLCRSSQSLHSSFLLLTFPCPLAFFLHTFYLKLAGCPRSLAAT